MRNALAVAVVCLGFVGAALAQPPPANPPTTTVDPTGKACVAYSVLNYVPSGQLFSCQSGVYALVAGSGSGSVTNIATACGLTGGPITTTGTVSETLATVAHNGSYAILTGDCGKSLSTNTAAAWTIAQAGTAGFTSGKFWIVNNVGSGSLTVTATTSTFYGGPTANISGSVLTVPANTSATIFSDGTNYQVLSGGGSGGGGSGTVTSVVCPSGTITTSGTCSAISREATFSAAFPTATITDSLGLSSPYLRLITISTISGNCGAVTVNQASLAANSFTATDSSGGTNICGFALSGSTTPPSDFLVSVVPTSGTSVFQSASSTASIATYTVTQTALGGYSGVVTYTCPGAPTGVHCTLSGTITGTGTATLTVYADYTASAAATGAGTSNAFTLSGTDGSATHTATGNPLGVWTGPVDCWMMNEGSSPMATCANAANNLTNTSVTYTNLTGLLPNTVTANGSTSSTVAANHTNYDFTGAAAFSVCGWFYENGSAHNNNFATNYSGTAGWVVASEPDRLTFSQINAGGNLTDYFGAVPLNTGTQFCVSTDGTRTSAGMSGYLNGAAQGLYATSGTVSGSIASGSNAHIGGYSGLWNTAGDGVADYRIFSYALTSGQVAALYAGGVK